MPAYRYQALDSSGRQQDGLLEADSARSARAQLRQRGLIPLEVGAAMASEEAPAGGWNRQLWRARTFNNNALSVWTRQLAGLVSSGLQLERALAALADEADQPEQQRLVASLRAEVNAGSSFARALGQFPREFDPSYRAVVAAGEQGGDLGLVDRLAGLFVRQGRSRGKGK